MNPNEIVYNVVYVCVIADEFQSPTIETHTFSTKEKAEEFLAKDFADIKAEVAESEDEFYGIISADNFGYSAEILWGEKDGEIVETRHQWSIEKRTIDYTNTKGE